MNAQIGTALSRAGYAAVMMRLQHLILDCDSEDEAVRAEIDSLWASVDAYNEINPGTTDDFDRCVYLSEHPDRVN